MTRTKHLFWAGLITFLLLFVTFLPAKSALSVVSLPSGFSFQSVEGSVWQPAFAGARWRDTVLGQLQFQPDLLAFIAGEGGGKLTFSGAGRRGNLTVRMAERLQIREMNMVSNARASLGQLALAGDIDISVSSMDFDRAGRCLSAVGELRTDMFAPVLALLAASEGVIAVPISCEAGRPVVSFATRTATGAIQATGRLETTNGVLLQVVLRFSERAAMADASAAWLARAGFVAAGDGWHREMRLSL